MLAMKSVFWGFVLFAATSSMCLCLMCSLSVLFCMHDFFFFLFFEWRLPNKWFNQRPFLLTYCFVLLYYNTWRCTVLRYCMYVYVNAYSMSRWWIFHYRGLKSGKIIWLWDKNRDSSFGNMNVLELHIGLQYLLIFVKYESWCAAAIMDGLLNKPDGSCYIVSLHLKCEVEFSCKNST